MKQVQNAINGKSFELLPVNRVQRRFSVEIQIALIVFATIGSCVFFATKAYAQETYALKDGSEVATLEMFQECDVCPEMIVLPMGRFLMGAPPEQSTELDFRNEIPPDEVRGLRAEGPVHRVEIDIAIAMSRNEVTHDEWMVCVREGACTHTPDSTVLTEDGPVEVVGRSPVKDVSYLDILEYTDWLNGKVGSDVYRLPTEAEWEYGARAGTNTPFAQGDTITKQQANFRSFRVESYTGFLDADPTDHKIPISVDQLDAANAWGLRHMSGNIRERTLSCFSPRHLGLRSASEYLQSAAVSGPCSRVSKGGEYASSSHSARPAHRGRGAEDRRSTMVGYRLIRELN